MVEVAAAAEMGLNRKFVLLNENLQFNEKRRGSIQLSIRWIYDSTVAAEEKAKGMGIMGGLRYLQKLILGKKKKDEEAGDIEDEVRFFIYV